MKTAKTNIIFENGVTDNKPHVVILGAGPAGLGAAFQLTRRTQAKVTVLEQNNAVGGNAGSFELSEVRVDYGSHRLHPACDPEILSDIRLLLGDELLDRPRHGRIRLHGRWIHFPLKPLDLILQLPMSFVMNITTDLISKFFKKKQDIHDEESFASVLEAGLGKTFCKKFYFPYAHKLWGLPPEKLSATQAHRRVSANSLGKMVNKILSAVPGIKQNGKGRFFYPRGGFGQISECLYQAAKNAGAEFHLGVKVKSITMTGQVVEAVSYEQEGQIIIQQADYVWSTIPVSLLVQCLQPSVPPLVMQACKNIDYRAMILIYLVLEQERFSEYDAHYFPELDVPITRISEPKNYSNVYNPKNLTVLCAELPCSTNDPVWYMTDEELGRLVCKCLESAQIPIRAPIKEIVTQRLRHAYPIYQKGYEEYLNQIEQWLGGIENLLTFGRQGLFVHDNTHHALYMAYAAVDCLNRRGCFDRVKWQNLRQIFNTHVVED